MQQLAYLTRGLFVLCLAKEHTKWEGVKCKGWVDREVCVDKRACSSMAKLYGKQNSKFLKCASFAGLFAHLAVPVQAMPRAVVPVMHLLFLLIESGFCAQAARLREPFMLRKTSKCLGVCA